MATSAAYIDFDEAAAPATPATGKVRQYAKTDGKLYQKDDAGTETDLAAASGGALTQAYAGRTTVGASWESMTTRRVLMKKITLANDCLLTNIEAHVRAPTSTPVNHVGFALFADNAGTPRDLLAYTAPVLDTLAITNPNARWMSGAMGRWLTAGDYWIAVYCWETTTTLEIAYDATGSDRHYTAGGNWISDAGFTAITTGSNDYSLRANTIR